MAVNVEVYVEVEAEGGKAEVEACVLECDSVDVEGGTAGAVGVSCVGRAERSWCGARLREEGTDLKDAAEDEPEEERASSAVEVEEDEESEGDD